MGIQMRLRQRLHGFSARCVYLFYPLRQILKKFYLSYQPYDGPTVFPISGPLRCSCAAEVAMSSGGKYTIVRQEEEQDFQIPSTNNPSIINFLARFTPTQYPPIAIAEIPGGHVYAGGAIFSPDGTVIARDLSIDFNARANSHYLCGRPIHKSHQLEGHTLSVASWGTQSYYHWLLDELPRYLIPENLEFDQIICSRNTAINREALSALGLENKKILFLNQTKHYRCELLTVPSYVTPIGHPSPYLVEGLKSVAISLIHPQRQYPEKLFISRQTARSRRIVNEDQIFSFFEAQGYTRICLEDFSWQDQINLFYYAREIVSPHGAGLANLVFCAQKPLVVELFNAKYIHWCFWKLARLVEADYIPLSFPFMDQVDQQLKAGMLNINLGDPETYIPVLQTLKS